MRQGFFNCSMVVTTGKDEAPGYIHDVAFALHLAPSAPYCSLRGPGDPAEMLVGGVRRAAG